MKKTLLSLLTLFTAMQISAQQTPAGMVRINDGTFTMGSPVNEPNRNANEGTQRQVTVSGFYMGRHQVTQAEYEAVMRTNPSHFRGPNLPVENVSWYDAIVFCNMLSMREGLSPAYRINGSTDPTDWGAVPTSRNAAWDAVTIVPGSDGYRLPTEAQWEFAARAGTTTAYNTGAGINPNQAPFGGSSANVTSTIAVGSFAPNAWGLYDMHGNVWEWCWDWHGPYPSDAQTDPMGASSGSIRVCRGGYWGRSAGVLRSAQRYYYWPHTRNNILGFRLVRP